MKKAMAFIVIGMVVLGLAFVAGCADDGGSSGGDGAVVNGGNPDGTGKAQVLVFTSPG